LLLDLGGMHPEQQVLDIGCGIGRVARPLAGYLREPGSYDGFDVVAHGVDWCAERYVDLAAPFRFTKVDVSNAFYNPMGGGGAASFRFPYEDVRFDLAFAFSVFTHLRAEEADHYLGEATRVLRPGGTLLATFFVLNDRAREHMARTPKARQFVHDHGAWSLEDEGLPAEAAIAYEESWLRERLGARELRLRGEIATGWWSGDPHGRSYQDVVVAVKG